MNNMKFCVNCKHYNSFGNLCVRGKYHYHDNPVTGEKEFKYKVLRSANEERDSIFPWNCGKKGRYFVNIKEIN